MTPNLSQGPISPQGARNVVLLNAWEGSDSWGNVAISGTSVTFLTGVKLSWDRVIFAHFIPELRLNLGHAPQLPT